MPRPEQPFAEPPDPREGPYESDEADASPISDDSALDAVLRETASAYLSDESIDPAAAPWLLDVARRHSRRDIVFDPIVVDLVEAVLVQRLEIAAEQQSVWRPVVEVVAKTLWDDAPSRDRLARFWRRLREALE